MALTPKQRRLRAEIEKIASMVSMDHWNIEGYEPDARTPCLKLMRDQLVRSEVIMKYTLLDKFLTDIICNFYFRTPRNQTYPELWKTKRFRMFVHFIMDETFLLKKLALVHAIKAVPKDISNALARINDTRNGIAHSFFPQERRRYMLNKMVTHGGTNLFTPEGVENFQQDAALVVGYLTKRLFGTAIE
jgi:hypothetical protein